MGMGCALTRISQSIGTNPSSKKKGDPTHREPDHSPAQRTPPPSQRDPRCSYVTSVSSLPLIRILPLPPLAEHKGASVHQAQDEQGAPVLTWVWRKNGPRGPTGGLVPCFATGSPTLSDAPVILASSPPLLFNWLS